MNERRDNPEFDELEPALDSAVQAVLAEALPDDAVERVKARATRLGIPTVSSVKRSTWVRACLAPLGRYSGVAAAVVVLAAVAVLWLVIDRTSTRAFADAIQNVKQADSVQLTITTRMGRQAEVEGKMYLKGDRLRGEMILPQSRRMLIKIGDLSQKRALFLDPQRQLAQSIDIDEHFAKDFANPIDQLRRARPEDARKLGEENVGGRLTHVYLMRSVDLLGIRGDAEMLVWVDPKDGVPVKIVIRDSEPKQEIRFEDFVWNHPIEDDLFSLSVPDGYQLGEIIILARPAESATPSPPLPLTQEQRSEGILSRDRVPSRIAWGPQGSTIIAIMRDPESVAARSRKFNELRLWDVETGELKWSVEIGGSISLAATADGKRLATVEGHELQLRDPSTGQVIKKWSTDKHLLPLAFSPDGTTLAAGIAEWGRQPSGEGQSGGVRTWDVKSGTLKRSFSDDKPTTFVRYSRDGKYLASAPNGGPVKVWDAANGEIVRIFPYGNKFDFSPDGKHIACMASQPIEGDTLEDVEKRYDVQIYQLETGELTNTLASDDHTKESWLLWIEFSPDGKLVAAANWDGSVKLWDVATGALVKTITEHDAGVLSAVFSRDGSTMATGSEDKTLRLWNVAQLASP